MNVFFRFLELFATFTEGLIVLSVSSSMCERKHKSGTRNILILLFTVIYTALITYMNTLESFSFATITVAVLYSFAVLFVISSGKLLLKAASTMITWFFVLALDYTLSYSLIMIIGKSIVMSEGFELIMSPGLPRAFFLTTNKLLQVSIFLIFKKIYSKLKMLDNKNIFFLLILSTISFVLIQILTGLIITDSVITIQIAVVFSMIFIVFSLISVIAAVFINAKSN